METVKISAQPKPKTSRSMLAALLGLFGMGARAPGRRMPSGNRSLPKEQQQEVMDAAQRRRERKMARPQGWYNG